LASCHDWRDIGGRHFASGRLKRPPGRGSSYLFGARAGFRADCRLTIRGGGNRQQTWHTDADGENGPAARSFAADAHDCIMVRIRTDLPNTSVWRDVLRPMASSPRMALSRKRGRVSGIG